MLRYLVMNNNQSESLKSLKINQSSVKHELVKQINIKFLVTNRNTSKTLSFSVVNSLNGTRRHKKNN